MNTSTVGNMVRTYDVRSAGALGGGASVNAVSAAVSDPAAVPTLPLSVPAQYTKGDPSLHTFPGLYRIETDSKGATKIIFDKPESRGNSPVADAPADISNPASGSADTVPSVPGGDAETASVDGEETRLEQSAEKAEAKPERVSEEKAEKEPEEKPVEKTSADTSAVDFEIRQLKDTRRKLQRLLNNLSPDSEQRASMEARLAQIDMELRHKDTDSYRRSRTRFTTM